MSHDLSIIREGEGAISACATTGELIGTAADAADVEYVRTLSGSLFLKDEFVSPLA